MPNSGKANPMSSFFRSISSILAVMSLLVVSACNLTSDELPEIDPSLPLRDQLQNVVNHAVESGLPGVSLHVQHRQESISVVAGVVDQSTGQTVTPSSLFHAASVGKTFTAATVLRLVDEGLFGLDDSIDSLLDPAMSTKIRNSDKITVRMLLAHTSGLLDYLQNQEFERAFATSPGRVWTPTELLDFSVAAGASLEPMSEFRYSNTNYVLLGVIAERAVRVPFAQIMREKILAPAGLKNTFGVFEKMGQPAPARGYLTAGYVESLGLDLGQAGDGSDFDASSWLHSEGHGDAPIHSTASDLNAFVRTLVDGDTLLSASLKKEMLTPALPGATGYGLGIGVFNNGEVLEHGGGGPGVVTMMAYLPPRNLSFGSMVSGAEKGFDEIHERYMEHLNRVLDRLH